MFRSWCWISFLLTVFYAAGECEIVQFEGNALYFQRSLPPSKTLIKFDDGRAEDFTARSFVQKMGNHVGFQGIASFVPSDTLRLEFRYTGALNFSAETDQTSSGGLTFPLFGVQTEDWEGADRVSGLYTTDFYAVDISYKKFATLPFQTYFSIHWGMGLSFNDFKDEFKLHYHKDGRSSKYTIRTKNAIKGAHFMLGGSVNPYWFLSWGLQGRLGGGVNVMDLRRTLFDNDNTVTLINDDKQLTRGSYYGEIQPYLRFRPLDWFHLNLGYQWMYYGDIADAAMQINNHPNKKKKIDHKGQQAFKGGYLGVVVYF